MFFELGNFMGVIMLQKTIVSEDDLNQNDQGLIKSKFNSRFNTIVSNTEYLDDHDDGSLEFYDELESLFEEIEKFSEGGQGEIKTAKDKKLHRYVALKSLKKDFLSNQSIVNNFIMEARITAQLDHPSIIPMYGIIREQNSYVHMAMKLVQGMTLQEIIDDHILECKKLRGKALFLFEQKSLSERLSYFIKICEAISYAHDRRVIHRDLKPENIMVGSFREVYLMDWGIAKIMTEEQENQQMESYDSSKKKSISGTPGFVAPEYILTGNVQFASDQYALGAILFQLVTLQGHISGDNEKVLLQKTLKGQLECIQHLKNAIKIPKSLRAIIAKSMSHDPKDRYDDVALLAEDINNFLQGRETIAYKDNLTRAVIRSLYKYKVATVLSILSVLLIFASITITSLVKQQQTSELAKERELTLINFQSGLEQRANQIDSHFSKLSNVLQRYADKVSYLLQAPLNNKQEQRFFDYKDFKNEAEYVKGLVPSDLYGHKVSVKSGNYKLAPGLRLEETKNELLALSPIIDDTLIYMAESSSNYDNSLNQEELEGLALNQGFAIRWVYSGLKNGLLVNYPGMGKLTEDYDVRTRFWFKHSQTQKDLFWSSPYIDLFGQGLVVSAVQPLYTKEGDFLGVSAIDITFDYAYNTIMAAAEDKKAGIIKNRYLINNDGKVILSNIKAMSNLEEAKKLKSEILFKEFPYPQLLQTIRTQKSGQVKIESNEQTKLIGFSQIPTLSWYYVEELNFESLLNK
ncbi:serine/threonine-protein kinase [Lentisphaera araneosa HTCC2155]|uniref:Serine/threonine-protein kinase n=2 Tax=Lentisphaera TaxID=256846 RepID=A6DHT2_9BACT|nr:serine/threonine-protein kinase [Lentisphaera araneosa HTCC2155]